MSKSNKKLKYTKDDAIQEITLYDSLDDVFTDHHVVVKDNETNLYTGLVDTSDDLASDVRALYDNIVYAVASEMIRLINSIPSQSNSLTYNGYSKTPSWNNYNSEQLTIGGTTSATSAGGYYATFTPKDGYAWSDGTTSSKSVYWSINKASGTYSASTSSSVNAGSSVSVSITKTGDASSTYVKSSDTSIATVTATASTITITGKAAGSCKITWYPRDTTNYTYPGTKSISVTVKAASRSQTFTSSGTFTVPAGVTTLTVTASAGGGGGGSGAVKNTAGSYNLGYPGKNGGATKLGSLISLTGGGAGFGGTMQGVGQDGTNQAHSAVSSIYGGGGTGGYGFIESEYVFNRKGGNGGRGGNCSSQSVTVTAGSSLTVTIGVKGSGGAAAPLGPISSKAGSAGQAGYMLINW